MRLPRTGICMMILFLIGMASAIAVHAQDISNTALQAGSQAVRQQLGTNEQPSNWTYSIGRASTSTLGCPLLPPGTPLGQEIVVFTVTYTFSSGQYVVLLSGDGQRVQLCDGKFDLAAMTTGAAQPPLPTAAPTSASPEGDCVITPNGSFSNVRSEPSAEGGSATIVGQITIATRVIGRNDAGDWYRIDSGWVSAGVVTATGNCVGAPPVNGSAPPGVATAPYCIFTASAAGTTGAPFDSSSAIFSYAPGETLLVLAETLSDQGSYARVMNGGGQVGWTPEAAGTLSDNCRIFLAQAPGLPGADQQCYVMVNVNASPVDAPDGAAQGRVVTPGERYAAVNRNESNGRVWYQISTFGRTPDGWLPADAVGLSEGCVALNFDLYTNSPHTRPDGRTPYCFVTAQIDTNAVESLSNPVPTTEIRGGLRYLVTAMSQAETGTWYRLFLRDGQYAWLPASAAQPSDGCSIFLAQAPGIPGAARQCTFTANGDGLAYTDSTAVQPVFSFKAGDRFATAIRTDGATGSWVRVLTFGITPDAWINLSGGALSEGCAAALSQEPPPPPVAQCVLTAQSGFANVRSVPSSALDSTVVGQLFGSAAAIGRSAQGDWYRIDGGWVARFVTVQSGDCASLPVVNN